MNEQQILDNAPEGATHVEILASTNFYYLKKDKNGMGYSTYLSNLWVASVVFSGYVRSLSDIKTIVEQQKRIAELEEFKLYYRNLVALHGYESITALLVSDGKKRERIAELEHLIKIGIEQQHKQLISCETALDERNDKVSLQASRISELEKENYKNIENLAIISNYKAKVDRIEKERDELKSTNRVLDNQLNELYHAMELISKIATVVPRDTAILEVINCYRTGELLEAHNLEQQAKGVDEFADGNLVGNDLVVALRCIESLHKQAKQLREGVNHEL